MCFIETSTSGIPLEQLDLSLLRSGYLGSGNSELDLTSYSRLSALQSTCQPKSIDLQRGPES